ncbi:MAG: right-handed parallel beta-helix repeat-containing protein [Chromatiales bacterium]|nr:right-handed parallel beta-helix repeat-containing protein [Chromatiales bacterium]
MTVTSNDGTGVITGVTPPTNATNSVVGILGAQNVTLSNVDIVGASGDTTGMAGIVLANGADAEMNSGAVARNHNGNGILLLEASSFDLRDATSRDNGRFGISIYSGSHADLTNAIIQDNGKSGVDVALSSSADIRSSTIQRNAEHGVSLHWNSAAVIRESSSIQQNGTPGGNFHHGLYVNEGSSARVNTVTITTTMANANDGSAVNVFRGSVLRLRGINSITASAAPTAGVVCPTNCPYGTDSLGRSSGGNAFEIGNLSYVRSDGGKTTVTGNVQVYSQSRAEFRDMEITGLFASAGGGSTLQLRDQSPADNTPTLTGTLITNDSLSIRTSENSERAIINGNVFCQNGGNAPSNIEFFSPATQGYVNCANQP